MCVFLRTIFQAAMLILTSFGQGEVSPLQNEPVKSPPRLELTNFVKISVISKHDA